MDYARPPGLLENHCLSSPGWWALLHYSYCAAKPEDNCEGNQHKNFLKNLATELLTNSVNLL